MIVLRKWSLEKQNKIAGISLIVTIFIYIVHSVLECLALYYCIECSAPWHVALLFTTAIYIIPLFILLGLKVYLVFRIKMKKDSL